MPIACTLTAREREKRGVQWLQLIRGWSARVAANEKGVTILFGDVGVRAQLEDLVAQERRCCAWMELQLCEDERGIVLTIGSKNSNGADAIRTIMAFGAASASSDLAP